MTDVGATATTATETSPDADGSPSDDSGEGVGTTLTDVTTRETNRWRGVTALSLLAAAAGTASSSPAALLLAVLGVAYAAYGALFASPSPTLTVERTVHADDPEPGDEVDVTLTVTNDGAFLPDLRLADDVPAGVEVVDGSPRLATALRSGKSATLRYTVEMYRGEHDFDAVSIRARDLSGARETEATVPTSSRVASVPDLPELASFPLRSQTVQRVGRVPTSQGGSGVEFHATREYRRGDPLSRVDWNRLARTGELSTVQYREERAATVVVVVDARDVAHVADDTGEDAVEYGVEAAGGVASALLDAGDRVGVAAFGPHWEWLAPGSGRDHRARLRDALARRRGFAALAPERRFLGALVFRRLQKHLPADAQVVFCSPLADDNAVEYVRRLEAGGNPATVVSPDVTGAATLGQQVARVERATRIRSLRRAGVRVVDWPAEQSLALAVATAARGWSQ
ncbi:MULTISPECIES: DUF58 domain-containing protein [Halobacterium]|uniref:DUF58 domain-containing protein n=1 Tax=Halobacterium TaxID=2239 RepID=UPI0009E847FA|nr:DUF58 domain-containing protein [Halobacterium sp. CBA1132]MCG1002152.1 DUF58 domain-containing protein [Halobacterium noricense]